MTLTKMFHAEMVYRFPYFLISNFSPLRLLSLSFAVTVLSQFIAQCMSVHVALSQGPYSLALQPLALVVSGLCKLVHLHGIHTYIQKHIHLQIIVFATPFLPQWVEI